MKYLVYLITLSLTCCGFLLSPVLSADYSVEDTNVFNVDTRDNGRGASIDKNTGDTSEKLKKLLYGEADGQDLIMDG